MSELQTAKVTDWTDAYANRSYISGAEDYPPRWSREAADFRDLMISQKRCDLDLAYGAGDRHRLDVFRPDPSLFKKPRGLIVFIHGGYWLNFDKSFWSHLSQGALAHGWAVAMPSYSLAPAVRISTITHEVGAAIQRVAALVEGPIRLAGHSAGGHLVTRMMCQNSPLPKNVRNRIQHVVSISGLHDLRPLMKTAMNAQLGLDDAEAVSESPALLIPLKNIGLTCIVGGDERPEFLRQNALLANIWTGLDVSCEASVEPGLNHFTILDQMREPGSALIRAMTQT